MCPCALFSFSHSYCHCAGGAAGIGKETALQYAKSKCVFSFGSELYQATNCAEPYRAKLVLGDLNEFGLESTVAEIKRAGGYLLPYF